MLLLLPHHLLPHHLRWRQQQQQQQQQEKLLHRCHSRPQGQLRSMPTHTVSPTAPTATKHMSIIIIIIIIIKP
jgi:hypothetical protein